MTSAAGIPQTGTPVDDLLDRIREERAGDLDWRGGRAFSLVYNVDDPDVERLLHAVADEFLHENALNPFRYDTLLRMETELIDMAAGLFGAPAGSGSLSSGGTESIFLAVYTARQAARDRGITNPNIVTAATAHPAFAKACHFLDVEERRIAVGADGRAVPASMDAAIDSSTALVVASSPCYPFGVIDPVPEIAASAKAAGTLCHVDACLGGWLLPFWESIGHEVPPWDLRVDGVTSLSADIHKYGYCSKGVSTVVYADPDMVKRQLFWFENWPGGLYASSTAAGTRPGAPIAAAHSVISHLGREGYERLARRVGAATEGFTAAIDAIDGVSITSNPNMSVFEFGADGADIGAIGDHMDDAGWALDRQNGGLHVMLSPGHDKVVDAFAADLAAAVAKGGTSRGVAAAYGGVVQADPTGSAHLGE